ncbi:MAG: nicotinate-nucleotide diphosphorylase (carboxylating) [Planctomycetes bacterium RBG_16_59_8]|nr:MAG: nicotinate-nucleotide diphosphorylase (carboxylating) [Planctomycetes bacterium RBG_16_59_8]
MNLLNSPQVRRIVHSALREDIGRGDRTSMLFIPRDRCGKASIILRERGVICGLPVARLVFRSLSPRLRFRALRREGAFVAPGTVVAEIRGRLRDILAGERVALNFLQRLSGIATLTRSFVDRVRGTGAGIFDTRKTTPLLRVLEKYAVKTGGGTNHRMRLDDAVLIKSNHLRVFGRGDLAATIRRARRAVPRGGFVEIEAKSVAEAVAFARLDVDVLMLDNFTAAQMKSAVRRIRALNEKVGIEASGGVDLKSVREIAATGVDRISVGMLTHSFRSMDIALRVIDTD